MDILFIPWLEPIDIPADLILPIFLPPLLWALARRTSWAVIRSQLFTVVSLSVLLILATIAAVAGTAYLLLPSVGIAASIVTFHVALAALAAGSELSVGEGIVDFLKSVIIAVMVGVAFGFGAAMLSNWMESTTARTALSWTVPFAVFLVAEEMHASGVIASVIASPRWSTG